MLTILSKRFTELAAIEPDVERIFSEVFARAANGKLLRQETEPDRSGSFWSRQARVAPGFLPGAVLLQQLA